MSTENPNQDMMKGAIPIRSNQMRMIAYVFLGFTFLLGVFFILGPIIDWPSGSDDKGGVIYRLFSGRVFLAAGIALSLFSLIAVAMVGRIAANYR